MNMSELKTDMDFAAVQVPEGSLLVFWSLDANGNVVKRYKDSSGNFGDM